MNGVIPLLQMMSPANKQVNQSKVSSSKDGEMTFGNLLSGFFEGEVEKPSIASDEKSSQVLSEVVLTDQLFELQGIEELLTLLPKEFQDMLTKLMAGEQAIGKEDLMKLSEIEQGILILLSMIQDTFQSSDSSKVEGKVFDIQKIPGELFPFLINEKIKEPEKVLERLIQHLQEKLNANPNANKSTKTFAEIFTKEESKQSNQTLSLPIMVDYQKPIGLNVSLTGQEFGQVLSKAQQATIHLGENQPREVREQQFLKQFQQLLQKGVFSSKQDGVQSLSIKLYPAHLGRLDIQLTQLNGSIVARILSGSSTTRELLESQVAQLKQAFSQQQLNVERIEISEQQFKQLSDEEESRKQSQEREADVEEEKQDSANFQEVLEEITINEQV
ncbi:flagellar hook-length control protein FliK [Bacillus solitudinis]|uniref:flagellar hook-length control protein FliK n=1 Tax=Bacillus solitudinis TaxID=2014074 RepID=UPI000C24106F|nr:flagellar hook-length control protein FliK [Bacillus solitudinis]